MENTYNDLHKRLVELNQEFIYNNNLDINEIFNLLVDFDYALENKEEK